MFIAWEQRFAFFDTLDAMQFWRGNGDAARIIDMWTHQYASAEDPVHDRLSDIHDRDGSGGCGDRS